MSETQDNTDNTTNIVEDAVEAANEKATAAVAQAGIGLQDLVVCANIIDLATQRGAFKAAEAGQVGATFNKLVAFVKAHQAAGTEEKGQPEEGVTPATNDEATSEEA